MKTISTKTVLVSTLFPAVVFADTTGSTTTLSGLIDKIFALINNGIIPLLVAVALMLFFFGIVRYIFSREAITKEEARQFLFWGIIALFVMTAVWGIVGILTNFISVDNVIPQVHQ